MNSKVIVIDIAINIAVCDFIDRINSIMENIQILNLRVGINCYNFCQESDARRIKAAERSFTDATKEARKSLLAAKKEAEEDNLIAEEQLHGTDITDSLKVKFNFLNFIKENQYKNFLKL